jgi:integrase
VFSRPDGSLENPNSFTTWMERRLTKIVGIPGLHPHALRHTHASHLLARGVPLADVAHRIGHANVNTLTKIYAHAIPVDDVGIADVWDTVEPDDE